MQYEANGYKVTMIFPKKYRDGTLIRASVWNAMTTELRELENDFSELAIKGEWRNGEDDESIMYFITVPTLERVNELQAFVKRWRHPFGQEAMYFDYHPVHYELIAD
jgi:hypothetical protein